jgi:hypothetical protein
MRDIGDPGKHSRPGRRLDTIDTINIGKNDLSVEMWQYHLCLSSVIIIYDKQPFSYCFYNVLTNNSKSYNISYLIMKIFHLIQYKYAHHINILPTQNDYD